MISAVDTARSGEPAPGAARARRRFEARHAVYAMLALAVALFVLLATRSIDQPGLYYDELIQIAPAQSFIDGGTPENNGFGTGPAITVSGHELQSMTMPYVGALKTVLFTPVAAAFDVSATSVRLFSIVLGALALLATYLAAARLFRSQAIAATAALLMAVDTAYVFYSRVDFGPIVLAALLKGVAGWQLLRWWDTSSRRSLVLGAFALGLGLYDKANFSWMIVAIGLGAVIFGGRALLRRVNVRTVLLAGSAFLVGALPLLIYNVSSNLGTVHVYDDLKERVPGGILEQLHQRVDVLTGLLDGHSVSTLLGIPFPHRFVVLPALAVIAAAAVCVQALVRRPLTRELRAGLFCVTAIAVVIVLAALTRPGFKGHHLLSAYPFVQLAVALVIVQVARFAGSRARPPLRRRVTLATGVALVAVPVVLAIVTTGGMLQALRDSGGRGVWSSRIYDLDRLLTRDPSAPTVAVDWGFSVNLLALSDHRLPVDDVTTELDSGATPPALDRGLRDRRTRYLLHSPDTTVYPRARARFFQVLRARGERPVLATRIANREGRPLYEIYRATAH